MSFLCYNAILRIKYLGIVFKLTCGTAIQYSQVVYTSTTIVRGSAIIPDNNNFFIAFEISHSSYVSFASILLSPTPVWSSDNSITDVFHLKGCNGSKESKIYTGIHHSSSCLEKNITVHVCLFCPSAPSCNLDIMSLPYPLSILLQRFGHPPAHTRDA